MLLQCLQLCVFKYCEWQDKLEEEQDQPLEIPEVIESAKDILASTVERMAKAELEDFELDKSSDFISDSGVGRKNRVLARLVMNTYEVSAPLRGMDGWNGGLFFCRRHCLNIPSLWESLGECLGGGEGGLGSRARSNSRTKLLCVRSNMLFVRT